MRQTTNYQFNHWDPEDRVLRTDFNADNEKLDAAIAAVQAAAQAAADACPLVKLLDITTTTAVAQVDVDLTGIDLTAYAQLTCFLYGGSGTVADTNLYLRCNGISDKVYYSNSSTLPFLSSSWLLGGNVSGNSRWEMLLGSALTVARVTSGWRTSTTYVSTSLVISARVSAAELETINFLSDDGVALLPAGTRIIFYGVKK